MSCLHNDKCWRLEDIADLMGVSTRTIHNYCALGLIKRAQITKKNVWYSIGENMPDIVAKQLK